MSIAVIRVSGGWPNWAHEISVIADGSEVTYVNEDGVMQNEGMSEETLDDFISRFTEGAGRPPETSADWAEIAAYGLGGFYAFGVPSEQTYSSVKVAVNKEKTLIKKSIKDREESLKKPRAYSDQQLSVSDSDTLEVGVHDQTDEVVLLTLGRPVGEATYQPFWRVEGQWSDTDPENLSDDELEDLTWYPVSEDYVPVFDGGSRSVEDVKKYAREVEPITAATPKSCPIATQDITVNIANRQKAIDGAGYGPLNPRDPNIEFWRNKANRWDATYAEAKRSICGNCSAFIRTPSMLECISEGLSDGGSDASNGWDTIDAGELGYCEAFDFKCAAERTCDAWIVGGPVTEEK